MKKRIVIILSILVIISVILGLYGTFATSSSVDATSSATYSITLSNNNSSVSVPAKSSKTIIYRLCNTNKGVVKYGIGYSGSNITVKIYNDSNDKETGLINYGENKFIKLYIENTGTTDSNATIETILGYENGGDLIVPNGTTLVTKKYIGKVSDYITNLYNNASKTVVTNNNIEYNIAPDVSLMNDRLGGTTSDYNAGNIRYYGKSPSNYINIGDKDDSGNIILYRIIGVFKDVTLEDGTKKDLVKVIRVKSIGNYSWDTSASNVNKGQGINEWSQADLMKLLNPGYENNIDLDSTGNQIKVNNSLWWNSQRGTCYSNTSNTTTTCDFTSTGLSDYVKNNIATVVWNTSGHNSVSVYSNQIYTCERGNNVIQNSTDGITRNTTWTGKVGLIYPSDYGYTTDFSKCTLTLDKYIEYNGSGNFSESNHCAESAWIGGFMEFFLEPATTSSSYVFFTNDRLTLRTMNASYGYNTSLADYSSNIRPTFYLTPNVSIIDGIGTIDNPYVIE